MSDITYSSFVKFLFDRPSVEGKWFFCEDFFDIDISPIDATNLICMVFEDCENLSEVFSQRSFSLGLQYIIDPLCGPLCYSFLSEEVPLVERIRLVESMFFVFERVFNKRCVESSDVGEASYNYICYMWWSVFPRHGIPRSDIDLSVLGVIAKILELDNFVCKKSALHGLGLWRDEYVDEVRSIILSRDKDVPFSLRQYMNAALSGDVE